MKNTLITDTGFWYGLINEKDRYHTIVTRFMEECRQPLVTTWPVLTETCYLLYSRRGFHAAQKLLVMAAENLFSIFQLTNRHMFRVSVLMEKYQDLPMDLADASLVILAEELGHGRILYTDQRDFQTYRWKNHEPFTNLLLT